MKAMVFVILFIGLTSCNSRDLKIGECVQKPDSAVVWKIVQKDETQIILYQNQSQQMEKEIVVDPSADGYIKTECL